MKSVNQHDHFLNEKQKEVKAQIMNDLLEAFFKNLQDNHDLFNHQSVLDLSFSVLVMFNRDVLTHLIKSFNLEGHRKQLMKDLHENIRDQVNKRIKESMV